MILRPKGSILIEVLLTCVIMSISLTILVGSLVSGYRLTAQNGDYFQAMTLFESHMARLYFEHFKDLSGASLQGQDGKTFSVNFETKSVNNSGYLNRLDALVSWPSGQKISRLQTSTFFRGTP